MKTEKLITFADNNRDEIHFEVSSDWLDKCLEECAESDAITDVYDNLELYIKGRKEQLYDKLGDFDFTGIILMYAIEDDVVVSMKEVIKN